MKVLIKGGEIINPNSSLKGKLDILFEKDKILKIEKNIDESEAKHIVWAKGFYVCPGFVDLHANFMDPGTTSKENLKTGCLGGAKGGFTSIVLGTENKPSPDAVNVIDYIKSYNNIMPIRIYPMAALTEGREGENMADLRFLHSHGAIGFSDGLRPIEDKNIFEQALKEAKALDSVVAIYPEDLDQIKVRGINECKTAEKLKVGSSPASAEEDDLEQILDIEKEINAKLDITYVSTKKSAELIKKAKKENLNVYAEVQALSLLLNDNALDKKASLAKVLPPLRAEKDKKSLIEGLANGTIDIISSNHMPCLAEEKEVKLKEAACGAIGLETVLGICGRALVEWDKIKPDETTIAKTKKVIKNAKTKRPFEANTQVIEEKPENIPKLNWPIIIEKISTNPAKLYSIDAGELKIGGHADITIFDPKEEWTVEDKFESKSHNTPLIGSKLIGKIKYTICKGICVYRDKVDEEQV